MRGLQVPPAEGALALALGGDERRAALAGRSHDKNRIWSGLPGMCEKRGREQVGPLWSQEPRGVAARDFPEARAERRAQAKSRRESDGCNSQEAALEGFQESIEGQKEAAFLQADELPTEASPAED